MNSRPKRQPRPIPPTPTSGNRSTPFSPATAYQGVTKVLPSEIAFLEWLDNLLDNSFRAWPASVRALPWIGMAARAFCWSPALCTTLVLASVSHRAAARASALFPTSSAAPGAPSAREWQLWLRDAQATAAEGEWREAIHFLYWASISRLESRRLWPADRARTPREYLGCSAAPIRARPRSRRLRASFERTWYGGREAQAADFNAALQLAAALGVAAE